VNELRRTNFVFELDAQRQTRLREELARGPYQPVSVPHAVLAAEKPGCRIVLYRTGRCVVQGSDAEDWVRFVLEPTILGEARLDYSNLLDPSRYRPHMGVDESGKGDFFGPMVIAAACVDPATVSQIDRLNVRDSKRISNDAALHRLAAELRKMLRNRFTVVPIGPVAYNRLYAHLGNVNRILAWGHARAIENLLARVADCPRALSDQFGSRELIEQALMKRGRSIQLDQRPKAEADPAVAAASILARAEFLARLRRLSQQYGVALPKGASNVVEAAAVELVRRYGPEVLLRTAKCHFQTTDRVLNAVGFSRAALGPLGQVTSRAVRARAAVPPRLDLEEPWE